MLEEFKCETFHKKSWKKIGIIRHSDGRARVEFQCSKCSRVFFEKK